MATTYLDLTNEILRELNEIPLTTANFGNATGFQQFVKDAINKSIFDIANEEPQLPFFAADLSGATNPFYGNVVVPTVIGQRYYLLKSDSTSIKDDYGSVDWDDFYLTTINVSGESAPYVSQGLKFLTHADWRRYYRDNENNDSADGQVYGEPKYERWDIPADESCPFDPPNDYSKTKVKQEELLQKYGKERKLPYVILRSAPIYGPYQVYGVFSIFYMLRKAGIVPYLGVVKRHRPDPFWLTHALDGWSFAMEFKVAPATRERLWKLCAEMTEVVLDAGGRFYFAKDLVLSAGDVERFLRADRLAAFRALKRRLDPELLLATDLSRRLMGW